MVINACVEFRFFEPPHGLDGVAEVIYDAAAVEQGADVAVVGPAVGVGRAGVGYPCGVEVGTVVGLVGGMRHEEPVVGALVGSERHGVDGAQPCEGTVVRAPGDERVDGYQPALGLTLPAAAHHETQHQDKKEYLQQPAHSARKITKNHEKNRQKTQKTHAEDCPSCFYGVEDYKNKSKQKDCPSCFYDIEDYKDKSKQNDRLSCFYGVEDYKNKSKQNDCPSCFYGVEDYKNESKQNDSPSCFYGIEDYKNKSKQNDCASCFYDIEDYKNKSKQKDCPYCLCGMR